MAADVSAAGGAPPLGPKRATSNGKSRSGGTSSLSSRNIAAMRAEYAERRTAEVAASSTLENIGEMNRDMDTARWRKRVGLASDAKVFVMTGYYPDFRASLLRRGWKQNTDVESPHWDLRFTLKPNEVNHRALHPHQQAHCFAAVDQFDFYPRAFDLSNAADYADFVDEFRAVEAEKVLRSVLVKSLQDALEASRLDIAAVTLADGPSSTTATHTTSGDAAQPYARLVYADGATLKAKLSSPDVVAAVTGATGVLLNAGVLRAALDVTMRRTRTWDDAALEGDGLVDDGSLLVDPAEWEVLRYCSVWEAGGPVEHAGRRVAAEEAARAMERKVNKRRDKLVKRLKKKGVVGQEALAQAATKAAAELGAPLPSSVEVEEEDGEDDDDEEGEEEDDGQDDYEDDGDDVPGDDGEPAGRGRIVHRDRGAVAATQLRVWRDRLAKEGGDPTVFSDSIGNPVAKLSSASEPSLATLTHLTPALWASLVACVASINDSPACQASLNSIIPRNIWIVKPAGKSRGRGIECESSLAYILNQRGAAHSESAWIAQKYIERPLLVAGVKWDIRQWVLVTSYNPLTVWFYDRCYLRFCCYPFELDNLSNKYVHLSNNSIQKHSAAFDVTSIEGNMWHVARFSEWLQAQAAEGAFDGLTYTPDPNGMAGNCNLPMPEDAAPQRIAECSDIWRCALQPALRRIVSHSLQAAQDRVEARTGSWEIFGYDFMVDRDLNPWLIEINSSPDFSYSTPVTEALVKEASEDVAKVVFDHAAWEAECAAVRKRDKASRSSRAASPGRGTSGAVTDESPPASEAETAPRAKSAKTALPPRPDTGDWQLIYKAPSTLTRTMTCTAHDIVCVGAGVRPPGVKRLAEEAPRTRVAAAGKPARPMVRAATDRALVPLQAVDALDALQQRGAVPRGKASTMRTTTDTAAPRADALRVRQTSSRLISAGSRSTLPLRAGAVELSMPEPSVAVSVAPAVPVPRPTPRHSVALMPPAAASSRPLNEPLPLYVRSATQSRASSRAHSHSRAEAGYSSDTGGKDTVAGYSHSPRKDVQGTGARTRIPLPLTARK